MAVGATLSAHGRPSPVGTLAETWNGTSWRVRTTPNSATRRLPHLADVSCTSPSECIAVGSYVLGFGSAFALAESWNGHAWRLLRPVSPGSVLATLNGVPCVRGLSCFAVGGTGAGLTLAQEWTGASWLRLPTPSP